MMTRAEGALKRIPARTPEETACLRAVRECERSCIELVSHCLKKGGPSADRDHVRLLLDCADACAISAKFILRESELHVHFCAACAEVCWACSEHCQAFQDDDEMMRCAEICYRTAESCRLVGAGR